MNTISVISIIITVVYLALFIYLIRSNENTKKLKEFRSGTLGNKNKSERIIIAKTQLAQINSFRKVAFWSAIISGFIGLIIIVGIFIKYAFISTSDISDLTKLMAGIGNFSISGIFAYLVKIFSEQESKIIETLSKNP